MLWPVEMGRCCGCTILVPLFAAYVALSSNAAIGQGYFRNGFKVGPDYARPDASVAPDWIYAEHPRVQVERWADRDQCWWTSLNDPVLTSLIETAYTQNLTLRAAGMRILQARAQLDLATGNLFPQAQQGFGGYSRLAESRAVANRGVGRNRFYSDWVLGGQLIWELDFWGRFRRIVAASEARLDARIEGYDDVLVLLVADVAASYIEIRTLDQRLFYARENLKIQEESARLARLKVDAGARESELDLPQAQANLAEIQSLIPDLELLRRQAMNRLSVLLGMPPADLTALLGRSSIPTPLPELALGIPADLLRQRPDVRRAERELAAQCEEIGVAVADLYPHFAINGTIYVNSQSFGDLFNPGSWAGAAGPSFRWDVLNYGRLRANIRLHEARFNELLYNYQQAVLAANEEAENAIAAFLYSHQKASALQVGADVSQEAVRIGSRRYLDGVSDFNRLSNLQTELARQQDELAVAKGAIAEGWVNVYRSLGGGWQIRLATAQPYMPGILEALPAPHGDTEPELVPALREDQSGDLKEGKGEAAGQPASSNAAPQKKRTITDKAKTLVSRLLNGEKKERITTTAQPTLTGDVGPPASVALKQSPIISEVETSQRFNNPPSSLLYRRATNPTSDYLDALLESERDRVSATSSPVREEGLVVLALPIGSSTASQASTAEDNAKAFVPRSQNRAENSTLRFCSPRTEPITPTPDQPLPLIKLQASAATDAGNEKEPWVSPDARITDRRTTVSIIQ